MANNNQDKSKNLTAVKMGLEVIMALAIVGSIYLIVIFSMELNKKETDMTRKEVITALITAVVMLVMAIIGLVGIVKENKFIVIILLVLVIISIVSYFYTREYWPGVYGIIVAVLTSVFLYLIIDKERTQTEV